MNATNFVNSINNLYAIKSEKSYSQLWQYAIHQAVQGNFAPSGALLTVAREIGVYKVVHNAFKTLGYDQYLTASKAQEASEWKGLAIGYNVRFRSKAAREAVMETVELVDAVMEVAHQDEVEQKSAERTKKVQARKAEHAEKMANDSAYRATELKKQAEKYVAKLIESGFSPQEINAATLGATATHYAERAENVAPVHKTA